MKTVISVRLTEERLAQIDAAARKLGMNRSQAIDAALSVFPKLISGKLELQYKPKTTPVRKSGGAHGRVE
jgi:hypothetical protein